jgi:hypothetical protein
MLGRVSLKKKSPRFANSYSFSNHKSVILTIMPRPRTINPGGETKAILVTVPLQLAHKLEREAKKRGVSVAQVARERLAQAS